MTKFLIIISAILMSGIAHAQMTSNPDGIYAGQPEVPQESANHPNTGAYYDWGMGRDRTGYCYQFTNNGAVLNGGYPVAEALCEAVNPSKANWARANNGYGNCYQFTPNNLVMYQGRPQPYEKCEKVSPSHYAWGRGNDGWTYCFQFTPANLPLNDGRAVPNEKCY